MPAVVWMTGLAILLSASLGAAALSQLTHSDRRFYWLVLAGLPLSFLVNRLVKIPLISGLGHLAGIPLKLGPDMPWWFIAVVWLTAPILEEAIKILPLALPALRRFLQAEDRALWTGLALGIGFGLGEIAYLAYGMAQSPDTRYLPWYSFTGFVSDRIIITFGHGLMTAIAILGLHYGGRRALLGYLAAVGLHALINLGPVLAALKLIPAAVAGLGSYAVVLVAFIIVQRQARLVRKRSAPNPDEIIYYRQG